MGRKILSTIVISLFIANRYNYAAAADIPDKDCEEYILAVNTSINGEISQSAGFMTDSDSALLSIVKRNKASTAGKKPNYGKAKTCGLNKNQDRGLDTKNFKVYDFADKIYKNKLFVLKYTNANCNIWLESNNTVSLTAEKINELGDEFNNNIYTKMTAVFGPAYDKDRDGKTAILLYDIQDGFDEENSPYNYGGYFNPLDLEGNAYNNMDVLHIDTYPTMGSDRANPDLTVTKSTIVHEFQHLINHSYASTNRLSEMPFWLNEGLSLAAEHMVYGTLTNLIDCFNSSDSIRNGHSLFYWDSNGEVMSNYALSYLFVQYLRAQTKSFDGGGTAIYKKLIQNKNRMSTVVKDVMTDYYPSLSMDDILINFRIATVANNPSGMYGFMGENDFDAVSAPLCSSTETASLRGGGAVIALKSTGLKPVCHSSNIKFIEFSKKD